MNDKDLEAFEKWIDSDVLSQDESALFKNMSEQERVVFVTERTWQAACEYKDMQLINGSKMKQMNERIEELIDENKKLREALEVAFEDFKKQGYHKQANKIFKVLKE